MEERPEGFLRGTEAKVSIWRADALDTEPVIHMDSFWIYGWTQEEAEHNLVFRWEENNESCDCNRSEFYGDGPADCGEGRYIVMVEAVGRVLYSEHPGRVGETWMPMQKKPMVHIP